MAPSARGRELDEGPLWDDTMTWKHEGDRPLNLKLRNPLANFACTESLTAEPIKRNIAQELTRQVRFNVGAAWCGKKPTRERGEHGPGTNVPGKTAGAWRAPKTGREGGQWKHEHEQESGSDDDEEPGNRRATGRAARQRRKKENGWDGQGRMKSLGHRGPGNLCSRRGRGRDSTGVRILVQRLGNR